MEKVEREMAGEYPNNAKLTTAKWWGQTAKSQSVKKKNKYRLYETKTTNCKGYGLDF